MAAEVNLIDKMKGWKFLKETTNEVLSAQGLNWSAKGTLERIYEMELNESISVYNIPIKRVQ